MQYVARFTPPLMLNPPRSNPRVYGDYGPPALPPRRNPRVYGDYGPPALPPRRNPSQVYSISCDGEHVDLIRATSPGKARSIASKRHGIPFLELDVMATGAANPPRARKIDLKGDFPLMNKRHRRRPRYSTYRTEDVERHMRYPRRRRFDPEPVGYRDNPWVTMYGPRHTGPFQRKRDARDFADTRRGRYGEHHSVHRLYSPGGQYGRRSPHVPIKRRRNPAYGDYSPPAAPYGMNPRGRGGKPSLHRAAAAASRRAARKIDEILSQIAEIPSLTIRDIEDVVDGLLHVHAGRILRKHKLSRSRHSDIEQMISDALSYRSEAYNEIILR